MKVAALVLTLVAFSLAPLAARQTPPRVAAPAAAPEIHTKIEASLATPGVMLATDYYQIDMRFGPNLRIDAVVVTDLGSQARIKGLRVQVHADQNPNQAAGASFLDLEEVVTLSGVLASMADQAAKWTGQDDRRATDLSFTTAGGFRVNIHQSGRVQKVVLSAGLTDPIGTSVDVADLPTLKQAIDQAQALLNAK